MASLAKLEQEHLELMQENNWVENDESIKLAKQYKELNNIVEDKCMECNRNSSITCQYH
jgi:hypothetical protein